jgi:fatty acid desaturase
VRVSENKVSQWLAELPQELQQRIRALHKPVPRWRLVILLLVGLWIGMAWGMQKTSYWPVYLFGYFVIGVVIHALAISMHECIHGNMFRNARRDYWFGLFLGLPALMSCTAYKVTHRLHHIHNRTKDDPDELTNLSKNRSVLSVAFYVWALIGMPLYLIHIAITSLTHGSAIQRWTVVVEECLIVAVLIAVSVISYKTGYGAQLWHFWLIPLIFAMLMANTRAWSEHSMTKQGHPLTQSRTVISNRVMSFFLCNQNYHLEHHLFPAIPWYQLPTLHQLLQDEYRKANTFIYKSYVVFMWDAFRQGVHSELPKDADREQRWKLSKVL